MVDGGWGKVMMELPGDGLWAVGVHPRGGVHVQELRAMIEANRVGGDEKWGIVAMFRTQDEAVAEKAKILKERRKHEGD